jgi:hypothetical protein
MRRFFIVHPILVVAYPALFVCAQNIEQFEWHELLRPLLILVLGCAVLWAVLGLILRDARKSALLASSFFLLVFSFTAAHSFMPRFTWDFFGCTVGPNKLLFALWIALFLAGAWATIRTRRDLGRLTQILNVSALVLILFPAWRIVSYEATARHAPPTSIADEADEAGAFPADPPDIYYIVMDNYGREDVLRDLYHADISDFTGWLRQKGFYVADRSTTNYAFTCLAVITPMQMDYVESYISPDDRKNSTDVRRMTEIANDNRLTRFLRRRGYTIIAFSSSAAFTDMKSADVYLQPGLFCDEFTTALMDMTPLRVVFHGTDPLENHRRRLQFTFDGLKAVAARPGPKFVYAHILSPHRPFVFDRNGAPAAWTILNSTPKYDLPALFGLSDEYRRFYTEQVLYLNQRLRETLEGILANSPRPPVIILRGDHGPLSLLDNMAAPPDNALRERFRILNAYYLAGETDNALYPEITPINSFRVVLNHFFGTRIEMLPDRNYFPFYKPYNLRDMTPIAGEGRTQIPAPDNAAAPARDRR